MFDGFDSQSNMVVQILNQFLHQPLVHNLKIENSDLAYKETTGAASNNLFMENNDLQVSLLHKFERLKSL